MNLWLQIGVTIYSLGIMPFLTGMMWTRKNSLLGLAKTYVVGYLSLFALFYVLAVPMIVTGQPFTMLAGCWRVVMAVVPMLWLLQFAMRRKTFLKQFLQYHANLNKGKEMFRYAIIIGVLLIVVSIGFIMPSPEDDVPETVAITLDTNTMYTQQPYTRLPYLEPELKIYAPIDMFYAVNADVAGMESTIWIHIFLPAFLLLFFYAVAWEVSGVLFCGKTEERGLFVVFSMILYTVSIGADRAVSFSVFQNIWNGATMLCCCILPLIAVFGFRLLEAAEQKKKPNIQTVILEILTIITAQLMLTKGAVLSVFSLICCVGIFIIRKGWEKLGILGKHKR